LKSLLHERFMYLYYTMIVMSLTTLLDKKSPLFSELCLQSELSCEERLLPWRLMKIYRLKMSDY